mmetsp:Transcript_4645/g.17738  ORF Transcript_4645/g.17738 Transcript_4645/m.17738 type:complete len:222 (+) Transcript_4645:231-896(+)
MASIARFSAVSSLVGAGSPPLAPPASTSPPSSVLRTSAALRPAYPLSVCICLIIAPSSPIVHHGPTLSATRAWSLASAARPNRASVAAFTACGRDHPRYGPSAHHSAVTNALVTSPRAACRSISLSSASRNLPTRRVRNASTRVAYGEFVSSPGAYASSASLPHAAVAAPPPTPCALSSSASARRSIAVADGASSRAPRAPATTQGVDACSVAPASDRARA